MKALVSLFVALAIMFAGTSVAQAGFPKSRQYMSADGYARWQAYLRTGNWR